MNRLDLAIVREMHYPGGHPLAGIDPLISAAQVARRVGVSRNTVRVRLNAWRQQGFLVRLLVTPNPQLFGSRLTGIMISCDDATAKQALYQAMELAEEVFSLTEIGNLLWLVFVERSPRSRARWTQYLSTLRKVQLVSGFTNIPLPPPTRAPTRTDWRVIIAFRALDRPQTAAVAKSLAISRRAVARHLRGLVKGHAVFVYPIWDFTHTAGAIPFLGVRVASDGDPLRVQRAVVSMFPTQVPVSPMVPVFTASNGRHETGASADVGFLLYLDSAAKVDEIVTLVKEIPGVTKVTIGFPSRTRDFPQCFDTLIAARTSSAVRSSPNASPRRGPADRSTGRPRARRR